MGGSNLRRGQETAISGASNSAGDGHGSGNDSGGGEGGNGLDNVEAVEECKGKQSILAGGSGRKSKYL